VSINAKHIEGGISYFKMYRDEGFTSSMDTAKHITSEMDIQPKFVQNLKERERNILMNKMTKMRKYNGLLWTHLEWSTSML